MWHKKYPLIPLKNIVIFPNIIVPIFVGRDISLQALLSVVKNQASKTKEIVFVLQSGGQDDPSGEDLYGIGILADLTNIKRLDKSTYKVLVNGMQRVTWKHLENNGKFFSVKPIILDTVDTLTQEQKEVYQNKISMTLKKYLTLHKNISAKIIQEMIEGSSLEQMIYVVTHFLMLQVDKKQRVLEENNLQIRADILLDLLEAETEITELEDNLHVAVKERVEKSQKEFYLKEKIKAIQEQLGSGSEYIDEVNDYKEKIEASRMPDEVKKKALREVGKLRNLSNISAEAGIVKGYLEWLLEVPWVVSFNKDDLDINSCRRLLNLNHYGLDKVKERIIEFLGVVKLTGNVQGSILCLAGPSGVGKTSIVKSIAQAMGKDFFKISLGGLNDESELRGHRRTYVGAMPGRIVQALHSTGTNDTVILLDEIDKISTRLNSNPSAVLLEILDSEQNKQFYDYYLEVPYDLSNVLFVATANNVQDIPSPLLDRMEVIKISGYSLEEKKNIVKEHLWPKLVKAHGLDVNDLEISEAAIIEIIIKFTNESGLRQLERELSTIIRKMVLEKLATNKKMKITMKMVGELLGFSKYAYSNIPDKPTVGTAIGLAYTERGGAVMPIEVSVFKGSGELKLTGKMGEVMQESAQAAISYVRFVSEQLGVKGTFYKELDIHIHVPENAVPKDGPSAGVTIAVALISALKGESVNNNVAMTGEISLHGKILPVGGLREKLMAAEQNSI
ncbi:MAG: endopeptidase La, partial [Candidatus Margulisbacteria bacterium]|nr:endopeptidase La [Candidatus Margulisiibacteriota bacterium]